MARWRIELRVIACPDRALEVEFGNGPIFVKGKQHRSGVLGQELEPGIVRGRHRAP